MSIGEQFVASDWEQLERAVEGGSVVIKTWMSGYFWW